jgi:hypothetical protein
LTIQVRAAVLGVVVSAVAQATPPKADKPSRPAVEGCAWERFSDAHLHLDAWVQRCDFQSRKIDFVTVDHSLAIRYSDGGAPDPVIDVLDLLPAETAEHGIRRLFDARTDKKVAARCVLAPYTDEGTKTPVGVKRYTFVPNAAYAKALKAKEDPNEVPDPACGDWGDAPDGIQYFEAQPASGVAKVLFVRIGQDEPLFDDATLRLK